MIAQNWLARRPQHDDNKGQSAEVVLGKTNLLLAFLGLLFFAVFCWLIPLLPEAFALMLLVLPVLMVTSRIWRSRRGQLEYGLMRHPLRRNLRPYLVQGANHWFFLALCGAVIWTGSFALVPAFDGFLFGLPLPNRIPYPPLLIGIGIGAVVMGGLTVVPTAASRLLRTYWWRSARSFSPSNLCAYTR